MPRLTRKGPSHSICDLSIWSPQVRIHGANIHLDFLTFVAHAPQASLMNRNKFLQTADGWTTSSFFRTLRPRARPRGGETASRPSVNVQTLALQRPARSSIALMGWTILPSSRRARRRRNAPKQLRAWNSRGALKRRGISGRSWSSSSRETAASGGIRANGPAVEVTAGGRRLQI